MATIIETIVGDIQKKHGAEAVALMSANPLQRKRLSTQCVSLDYILGGGLAQGTITEIMGAEGSGKTTLALHIVAECQRQGGIAMIIDAEHALDTVYMKAVGIDAKSLIICQPATGEEAMKIAYQVMESKIELANDKPLVIVIDSIAALATEAEFTGEITDYKISPLARFMSDILRRITSKVSDSKAVFVCLNQLRTKIGGYGNPMISSGGKALKFYASARIELRPSKKIMSENKGFKGQIIHVKTVKNKTYIPFLEADFQIIFGQGINIAHSIVQMAIELGVVTRSGTWIRWGDNRKYQGVKAFVDELEAKEKLRMLLRVGVELKMNELM